MSMECGKIVDVIKTDFNHLWLCKMRGKTVEVSTPFSTITKKFITVFIKFENDEYVVSDGGWLNSEFYDIPETLEKAIIEGSAEIHEHIFHVKKTKHNGINLYYKKCKDIKFLSACVYDLCNFISNLINTNAVYVMDKEEKSHQETFQKKVNDFIKTNNVGRDIQFNGTLDDLEGVKFNVLLKKSTSIYLVNYISGSSNSYFTSSLTRASAGFEISKKSKLKDYIHKRIPIVNDQADGYHPDKQKKFLDLLEDHSSCLPISWIHKDKILEEILA